MESWTANTKHGVTRRRQIWKTFRKTDEKEHKDKRYLLTLDLKIIGQRKEMVEDFPVAFRNVDVKIMQTTRTTSGTNSVSSD